MTWPWHVRAEVALAVGDAFLAGDWHEIGLVRRALRVIEAERQPRWLRPLALRALATYRECPADSRREFLAWVTAEIDRIQRRSRPPVVAHHLFPEPAMCRRRRWDVPELASTAELASFLALRVSELEWFADIRGLERSAPDERLRHYRYVLAPRGDRVPRMLECPKPHLKELQRWLLHSVLDRIPPHVAAHGFRPGHSVLTHARRHVGQRVVVRFDLEDFFASVSAGRIYGIFRAAGYPEPVAHKLTGLCTNVVPRDIWNGVVPPAEPRLVHAYHRLGSRLAVPHLPQGAPTSPALANLAAYRLDARLAGLAASVGAVYSRYADDLAFSGERWLIEHARDVRRHVAEIVEDEGFRLNERKSRLTTSAGRQVVTGVVVNERLNVSRVEFDRVKAILHDARRNGPATANRRQVGDFRGHLAGRVAWIESLNARRGAKLRRLFEQIDWQATPS